MFKSFNFATANLMMFMMGFMLFSTLVLIPEFLQTLMGYTAELAGLVLSGGGVVLLVMKSSSATSLPIPLHIVRHSMH